MSDPISQPHRIDLPTFWAPVDVSRAAFDCRSMPPRLLQEVGEALLNTGMMQQICDG